MNTFVDPQTMGSMYIRQGYPQTHISDAFFTNLPWLIQDLNKALTEEMGFDVEIVPDSDLYLCCVRNNMEGTPQNVFSQMLTLHRQAIKRHCLFKKWYLDRDRSFIEQRPMLTNGRHRFAPLSTADYSSGVGGMNMEDFQAQINNNSFVRGSK